MENESFAWFMKLEQLITVISQLNEQEISHELLLFPKKSSISHIIQREMKTILGDFPFFD
jgi:hypothetical protein